MVQGFATWDETGQCPRKADEAADHWATNNPAYELFCIQAQVHRGEGRSPSPDNTEAQVPDLPSEMTMDGDADSLANVLYFYSFTMQILTFFKT